MTRDERIDFRNLGIGEVEAFISRFGKERYRARQIMKWIYQRGAGSFNEMTDLSKELRLRLDEEARLGLLSLEDVCTSRDGTKKVLLRMEDGLTVESVLIREKNHYTQCVSTQVGCAMGCAFCLTGEEGLKRNLLPGEIAGQIGALKQQLPEGGEIRNVVMMGMGEPLANYDNVLRAIDIITCVYGLGFSRRRITVSTCGLAPLIGRLGRDACVNLAVSLNSADDETRSRLMPVNRTYPLAELVAACRDYPMPRRRMITLEYILIRDVNDSEEDARKVVRLFRNVHCKFNLIPFNEYPGAPFRRPSAERINRFRQILIENRFTATTRPSKGADIMAACGQLRGRSLQPGDSP